MLGKLGTLVTPGGTLVEAYVGKLLIESVESLEFDRNEVEELIKVPFRFFLETPPETYELIVETQPYCERDGKKVLFPARELGLPEMYHQAWRGRNRRVYLYRYGDRVIWGIAGEIVYETVKRAREALDGERGGWVGVDAVGRRTVCGVEANQFSDRHMRFIDCYGHYAGQARSVCFEKVIIHM